MRVNGVFTAGRGAFVRARIYAPLLPRARRIPFLIDIGSSDTILAHRDFIRLGGDFTQLSRSPIDLLGIGGSVAAYELPSVVLAFTTADGGVHTIMLPIMLVSNYNALPLHLRVQMLAIPSVLGRDILDKYRLVYDPPANEVFFTDE